MKDHRPWRPAGPERRQLATPRFYTALESPVAGTVAGTADFVAPSGMVTIRPAHPSDSGRIFAMLEPVIRAGEVFALPRDMSQQDAIAYWFAPGQEVFVAESDDSIVGSYYIRPNQLGGGAHVANCGYLTDNTATGRGIARAMCDHSLEHARARGDRAMQFNFVIRTNERAVRLWQSFDFRILATLPEVFDHPSLGFVDAYVMFREL
jgi:ribosomal protein S18 acetylase RimI-like enzyme